MVPWRNMMDSGLGPHLETEQLGAGGGEREGEELELVRTNVELH